MKFNDIIDSALSNDIQDQDSFERDFKVIAASVESRKPEKNDFQMQAQSFYFSANLDKIVEEYQREYDNFSRNLVKFCKDSMSSLDMLTW